MQKQFQASNSPSQKIEQAVQVQNPQPIEQQGGKNDLNKDQITDYNEKLLIQLSENINNPQEQADDQVHGEEGKQGIQQKEPIQNQALQQQQNVVQQKQDIGKTLKQEGQQIVQTFEGIKKNAQHIDQTNDPKTIQTQGQKHKDFKEKEQDQQELNQQKSVSSQKEAKQEEGQQEQPNKDQKQPTTELQPRQQPIVELQQQRQEPDSGRQPKQYKSEQVKEDQQNINNQKQEQQQDEQFGDFQQETQQNQAVDQGNQNRVGTALSHSNIQKQGQVSAAQQVGSQPEGNGKSSINSTIQESLLIKPQDPIIKVLTLDEQLVNFINSLPDYRGICEKAFITANN